MNNSYLLVGIICKSKNDEYNEIELILIDDRSYFVTLNFEYYWKIENEQAINKHLTSQRYFLKNSEMLKVFLAPLSKFNPITNIAILGKYSKSFKKCI